MFEEPGSRSQLPHRADIAVQNGARPTSFRLIVRHRTGTLDSLYDHCDALAGCCDVVSEWEAHVAVQDRLAESRRKAEAQGWTSCAIERMGRTGRLRVWGVPPGRRERYLVPDWPLATDNEGSLRPVDRGSSAWMSRASDR
jgi:hypothetical protein